MGTILLFSMAISQTWFGYLDTSPEAVFLMMFLLIIAFLSEDPLFSSELLKKISRHLGKLSMPIFCVHTAVMECVQLIIPEPRLSVKFEISMFVIILLAEILVLS